MLINGAGGGSGAFRQAGRRARDRHRRRRQARVHAVRGADEVGDHRRQDFGDFPPFDRILDLVATRSPFACRRALAPGGHYKCVGGGTMRTLLPIATVEALLGRATGRRIGMLVVRQGPPHFEPSMGKVVVTPVETQQR